MENIRYMLVLALLISGCEDMKMDRKVSNNLELQNQVSQLFHF
jgi:PBP1b-binding outer membrane lipoprotein LpoB